MNKSRTPSQNKHSVWENIFGVFLSGAQVSFGVFLLYHQGLLTGGTAGLTIFLTKVTDLSFGQLFVLVNIPFYILAVKGMGWRFTIATIMCVVSLSLAVDYLHLVVDISSMNPVFAGVMGGTLIGLGTLGIFRHKLSFGGFNILVLYLQNKKSVSAGKVQMVLDCSIVILSLLVTEISLILISILGAVFTNMVLTFNHKPGRYFTG